MNQFSGSGGWQWSFICLTPVSGRWRGSGIDYRPTYMYAYCIHCNHCGQQMDCSIASHRLTRISIIQSTIDLFIESDGLLQVQMWISFHSAVLFWPEWSHWLQNNWSCMKETPITASTSTVTRYQLQPRVQPRVWFAGGFDPLFCTVRPCARTLRILNSSCMHVSTYSTLPLFLEQITHWYRPLQHASSTMWNSDHKLQCSSSSRWGDGVLHQRQTKQNISECLNKLYEGENEQNSHIILENLDFMASVGARLLQHIMGYNDVDLLKILSGQTKILVAEGGKKW